MYKQIKEKLKLKFDLAEIEVIFYALLLQFSTQEKSSSQVP